MSLFGFNDELALGMATSGIKDQDTFKKGADYDSHIATELDLEGIPQSR